LRELLRKITGDLFLAHPTLDFILALLHRCNHFRMTQVNLLLRLTMPDILINFAMACSRCSFVNFVGGFIAMIPWIVLHAW